MKRFATFLLALTMLASVGSIAYADDLGNGSGNQTFTDSSDSGSIDISAHYSETAPEKVYSVNVSWPEMTFNCIIESKREWNPDTHQYGGSYNLRITDKTKSVTVLNRSNADVSVKATVEQATDPIKGVELVLLGADENTETFTLDDASGTGLNMDHSLTISLSKKTGEEPDPAQFTNDNKATVGKVTITLQKEDGE